MENNVGANTHPRFTPLLTGSPSDILPASLTLAIISVCSDYHLSELLRASVLPKKLPRTSPSNCGKDFGEIHKTHRDRLCSIHFSGSCLRRKIMSTVRRLFRNLHKISLLLIIVIFLCSCHTGFDLLFWRWWQYWHPSIPGVQYLLPMHALYISISKLLVRVVPPWFHISLGIPSYDPMDSMIFIYFPDLKSGIFKDHSGIRTIDPYGGSA